MLWGWTRPQQQQSQHHLAPLLCIQVQRKRLLLLETTSSTAIPTTGASLTSGPVYTDAREALTEAPIRAAAPLKSPKCILFSGLKCLSSLKRSIALVYAVPFFVLTAH